MRAGGRGAAHRKVVANQVQKGFAVHGLARAVDGMPVAQRPRLRHEAHAAEMLAGGLRVTGFVARRHHHRDLFHPRGEGLFDEDPQDRFLLAVLVDESL